MVKVEVEYCGICNFTLQCQLLRNFLMEAAPGVDVVCEQGRRGSFEVKIDDQLVHSKLSSLAFPKHESVLTQVQCAQRGEPLKQVEAAPIKDCNVM